LIPTGERAGLRAHIAAPESFRDAARMKVQALVELELAISPVEIVLTVSRLCPKLDAIWKWGEGRKLFSRSFLLPFQDVHC
jgi:hypothetical protein